MLAGIIHDAEHSCVLRPEVISVIFQGIAAPNFLGCRLPHLSTLPLVLQDGVKA